MRTAFAALISALLVVLAPSTSLAYPVYADYAGEFRTSSGRVDGAALVSRLVELHATTYAFLICHGANDYADLAAILPLAKAAGLGIWAYLVPPTETGMNGAGTAPAACWDAYHTPGPPCSYGDYVCWGTKLGELAQAYPETLSAIVMDDFIGNTTTFTTGKTGYLAQMLDAVHAAATPASPEFLAVVYDYGTGSSNQLTDLQAYDYLGLVDGVIFPYGYEMKLDVSDLSALPSQVQTVCASTKEHVAAQWRVPGLTPSSPGDLLAGTGTATVVAAAEHHIAFTLHVSYGGTAGYHFFQVLVDGANVYERDAYPEATMPVNLDVGSAVAGKTSVSITFRIYDKQATTSLPVSIAVSDLAATGLAFSSAPWSVSRTNASTWTFAGVRHCVLMVYTTSTSWYSSAPATEYIAEALSDGHDQMVLGNADGVITYDLDKADGSVDFATVEPLTRRGPRCLRTPARRRATAGRPTRADARGPTRGAGRGPMPAPTRPWHATPRRRRESAGAAAAAPSAPEPHRGAKCGS